MKTKLFFVLLIMASLGACKQKPKANASQMKKVVSLVRPDSSTFTYTPDGKLLARVSFGGAFTQNFLYDDKRVVEEGIGPMNNEPFHIEYTLNEKGQGIKSVRTTSRDTICLEYVFNNAGYKIEEYLGCDKKELVKKRVWENGNNTTDTLYARGQIQQIIRYTYYDLPNRPNAYGEQMQGYAFKGKDSKNLMKQMVMVRPPDQIVYNTTFTYKFDDQDRIAMMSLYDPTGRAVDSTKYIY